MVGIVGCEQFRLRFEVSADRRRSPTFLVVRHMSSTVLTHGHAGHFPRGPTSIGAPS